MNISSIDGTFCPKTSPVNRSENTGTDEISGMTETVSKKNRDGYFPSEEEAAIGLYKLSENENGEPYIDYDAPEEKEESEKCTANTDKVDREIKELKEKAAELRRQIKSASEDRRKELENQLRMTEAELSQKDRDGYRRENTVFSVR